MQENFEITTLQELQQLVVTSEKQRKSLEDRLHDHIHQFAAEFIQNSPLLFMATSGSSGNVDVSPKGDAPGFVNIQDNKTLIVPERIGNTDARGFRNILTNNSISLLFIVPKTKEVLRVNGFASLTRDPELLGRFVSCGKPALLCIRIDVQECFFHCARAFNRSHLWNTAKWPEGEGKYFQRYKSNQTGLNEQEFNDVIQNMLEDLGEENGAF